MALKDKPNHMNEDGFLYCYDVDKIPRYYASRAEWRRRGYKVVDNKPAGNCYYWNGQSYLDFYLYELGQVVPIRGEKAKQRRDKFNCLQTITNDVQ